MPPLTLGSPSTNSELRMVPSWWSDTVTMKRGRPLVGCLKGRSDQLMVQWCGCWGARGAATCSTAGAYVRSGLGLGALGWRVQQSARPHHIAVQSACSTHGQWHVRINQN